MSTYRSLERALSRRLPTERERAELIPPGWSAELIPPGRGELAGAD
jgi:hypothetical protein